MLLKTSSYGLRDRDFAHYEPVEAERDGSEIAELLARGVDAHVSAVHPLERAADALAAVWT